MKISELAKKTNVSTHRLRRYEELGLIKSTRGKNGYRVFSETVLREVIFIAMARECGFSMSFIEFNLPKFRDGTLTIKEMMNATKERIKEVEVVIKDQQILKKKLKEHIKWFIKKEIK
jgi:DNA-binding transcriptional MerR regulator